MRARVLHGPWGGARGMAPAHDAAHARLVVAQIQHDLRWRMRAIRLRRWLDESVLGVPRAGWIVTVGSALAAVVVAWACR